MSRRIEDLKVSDEGPLTVRWLPGRFAICRLPPAPGSSQPAPGYSQPAATGNFLPDWATRESGFLSITRTEDELSIIIDEQHAPRNADGMLIEPGWAAMRIVGRLEFSQVGILARLSGALAAADVPLCAVSTFDTDIILVKANDKERAAAALATVARFDQ